MCRFIYIFTDLLIVLTIASELWNGTTDTYMTYSTKLHIHVYKQWFVGEVSNWKLVLSGVSQESAMGPTLFLIYINDFDGAIYITSSVDFLRTIQVFIISKHHADNQQLQYDRINEWSEKWKMLFNFGKCKCFDAAHCNEDAQYAMGGIVQTATVNEQDIGLTISIDKEVSEQFTIAATKGNHIFWINYAKYTVQGTIYN